MRRLCFGIGSCPGDPPHRPDLVVVPVMLLPSLEELSVELLNALKLPDNAHHRPILSMSPSNATADFKKTLTRVLKHLETSRKPTSYA